MKSVCNERLKGHGIGLELTSPELPEEITIKGTLTGRQQDPSNYIW